jgi:hypothetical protein
LAAFRKDRKIVELSKGAWMALSENMDFMAST